MFRRASPCQTELHSLSYGCKKNYCEWDKKKTVTKEDILYPLRTLSQPVTRNHIKVQSLRNKTFKWTDHSLFDVQNVLWCLMENSLMSNFVKAESLFYS